MAEEEKRYFTVRAVEALIPRLETIMTRVMDAQAEATRLRTALEAAQREVVLSGGMRLRQEWWRARRAAPRTSPPTCGRCSTASPAYMTA